MTVVHEGADPSSTADDEDTCCGCCFDGWSGGPELEVLSALNTIDVARGFEAGISIVFIAING